MERLTRFAKNATVIDKREFARELVKALDRLGVEPGEGFVIDNIQPTLGDPDVIREQHHRDTAAANR